MYTKRLIHTVCQLPDVPKEMFDACHVFRNVKIIGMCSRLILTPKRQTTIITPSSASYTSRNIIKPQYWVNPDTPHEEVIVESGN